VKASVFLGNSQTGPSKKMKMLSSSESPASFNKTLPKAMSFAGTGVIKSG
jgi:hypothetical protein